MVWLGNKIRLVKLEYGGHSSRIGGTFRGIKLFFTVKTIMAPILHAFNFVFI